MGTQKSQRGRGGRRGRGRGGGRHNSRANPVPGGGAKRRRAGLGNGVFDDGEDFISLDQYLDADTFSKPRVSRKKFDVYEETTPTFTIEQPKRENGSSAVYRLPIEFVLATDTKIDLAEPMIKTTPKTGNQDLPSFHLPEHEREGLGNTEAESSETGSDGVGFDTIGETRDLESRSGSEEVENALEEALDRESEADVSESEAEDDLSECGHVLKCEDESFEQVKNAFEALDPGSSSESLAEILQYDSDALSVLDSDFDVSAQGLDSDDIDRIRRLDPLGADPRARDWRMGDDDDDDEMDSAEELLRELINSGRQSGYSHMDEYLDDEFGTLPSRPKRLGKKARRRLARETRAGNVDAVELPSSKHLWLKYPTSISRQELFSELSEFVLCSKLDSDDEECNYNGIGKCPPELCLPPSNSVAKKEQLAMAASFGLVSTKRKLGKFKYLVFVTTKRSRIPPRSGELGALLQEDCTYTRTDIGKADDKTKSKDRGKKSAHVREGTVVGEHAEKIASDNFGHRLLTQMGWSEGQGLGSDRAGIVAPVSATMKTSKRGVGLSL